MPSPARGPTVLYTPAGLAEIASKGGRKVSARTVHSLVASGEIVPEVVLYGKANRMIAMGFRKDQAPGLPERGIGRPRNP